MSSVGPDSLRLCIIKRMTLRSYYFKRATSVVARLFYKDAFLAKGADVYITGDI